jgi:hypothetical protein
MRPVVDSRWLQSTSVIVDPLSKRACKGVLGVYPKRAARAGRAERGWHSGRRKRRFFGGPGFAVFHEASRAGRLGELS